MKKCSSGGGSTLAVNTIREKVQNTANRIQKDAKEYAATNTGTCCIYVVAENGAYRKIRVAAGRAVYLLLLANAVS